MTKYRPSRESSSARQENAGREMQRRGRQLLRKQIERQKKTQKPTEKLTGEQEITHDDNPSL